MTLNATKHLLPLLVACLIVAGPAPARDAPAAVKTGLETLIQQGYAPLAGKRVGVVTNHTGVDLRGRPVYSLLAAAPEVDLAAVFAPEHGLRGAIEGEYESGRLPGDTLAVYSLYGAGRSPQPEQMAGLDALVFDIQDIGCRFYTYITTMALCMKAAAEAGSEFYVLDRPNPVGGLAVEGPVLEEELTGNFIAYYPIPVRHGMTVGELAKLFNEEFGIGADLTVVPMNGWRRWMYYDQTGLPWIDPSPNMRSLTAAILYPGLGIAEATNLSVGRGTDIPFEIYGAPYVNEHDLAAELRSAGIAGAVFRDTTFTPVSHVFPDQVCRGVRAEVTDRTKFHSVRAGLHLLSALQRLHPRVFDLSGIDKWIGRGEVKHQIERGVPVEEIVAGWQEDLRDFIHIREKYLIYPE